MTKIHKTPICRNEARIYIYRTILPTFSEEKKRGKVVESCECHMNLNLF